MFQQAAVEVRKTLEQVGVTHELVFRVRPPTAAQRKAIQEAARGENRSEAFAALFTPAFLALCLEGWEGLAGADGAPLPCTPENVASACDYAEALHAALMEAVLEATPQLVRGNSKPSPLGSSADEGATPAGVATS